LQSYIKLQNIKFAYNQNILFKNLNLTIENNKKYAIYGDSGTGKSTLLKIIMQLYEDYEGKIFWDALRITDQNSNLLRSKISYISQNNHMFIDTIKNNIIFDLPYDEELFNSVIAKSGLKEIIDSLPEGADYVLGETGTKISGGQKQRIAIARALYKKNKIFIIDEATSSLDKASANSIEGMLLSDPDITLINISHHLTDEQKKKYDFLVNIKDLQKD